MGITSGFLLLVFIVIRLVRYLSSNSSYDRYDSTPLQIRRQPAPKKEVVPGNPFYTNAPEHWGIITDEFLTPNKQLVDNFDEKTGDYVVSRRKWMVNSLVLMGRVNDALQKKKGGKVNTTYGDGLFDSTEQYATSCCIEKLFEKGIISITGVAIDDYKRYGVILCEAPTPIKYINELRQYFINDGYADLIYFALADPNTVAAILPLKFEDFNKSCFKIDSARQNPDSRRYNSYAMWWADENEPTFKSAVIKDDIRIYLDMLDFHNSYALGILSFALGLKDSNGRIRLPDYSEVTISGPEGVEIIMSLSAEHGINFHFPMLPRFEKYRNNFIKVYVNFCYNIRAQIVEHDWPNDDFEIVSTLLWYEQLLDAEASGVENITSLGCLTKAAN